MNGFELMAQALKAEGVEYLFAFPYQNLIEVGARAGLTPVICRQERAGVNMADGYSRITNGRRIGVFTMQRGPGAENAFPAWPRPMPIQFRCSTCPAANP